ncbi:hypothetical protein VKT23_018170 [Stygiomarasmius scandens]|uniref:Uncharacterized protein n=1 Tax=Marasmiellus scandens TaxID=2682957 RepID=A0ABR1IT30_9AGAR
MDELRHLLAAADSLHTLDFGVDIRQKVTARNVGDRRLVWNFERTDNSEFECVIVGRLLGVVESFWDVGCGWGSYTVLHLGVQSADDFFLQAAFWNQVTSLDTCVVEQEEDYCKYGKPTWHQELNHFAAKVNSWTSRRLQRYGPLTEQDRVYVHLARDCLIRRSVSKCDISAFAVPTVKQKKREDFEWWDACTTGSCLPFKDSLTVDDFIIAKVEFRKCEVLFDRRRQDYDEWFFSLIASELLVYDSALI